MRVNTFKLVLVLEKMINITNNLKQSKVSLMSTKIMIICKKIKMNVKVLASAKVKLI